MMCVCVCVCMLVWRKKWIDVEPKGGESDTHKDKERMEGERGGGNDKRCLACFNANEKVKRIDSCDSSPQQILHGKATQRFIATFWQNVPPCSDCD